MAMKNPRHADNAVTVESADFQRYIHHNVERIRNNDQNRFGGFCDCLFGDRF